MSETTFDDFEYESDLELIDSPPLWTMRKKNDEELLKWLNDDWEDKVRTSQPRIRTYRGNLALYKGIHYRSQETRSQDFRRDQGDKSIRNPKIVVNHVFDMIETKTAKMSRFKPGISVIPTNNEWHDKINSKTVELLVKNRWDEVDFEEILRDQQRGAYTFGDTFIQVWWNRDAGNLHPLFEKAKKLGIDVPRVDQSGKRIELESGETAKIEQEVRIGDVDYDICYPDEFFPRKVDKWVDCEQVTRVKYIDIEELKAMYPAKVSKIKMRSGTRFDPEGMTEIRLRNEVRVKYLWHKPTKNFPEGAYIVYTEDVVLEREDFPYDHHELPFIRLTDIDVPTEMFGRSFLTLINQLQRHFNNLASGIARNHGLAGVPKWVMPKGACKINSLNNEFTVIEYNGPVPPRLEQLSPTSPEIFVYMDKLEAYIQKLSAVHGISRGTPPPGIRAGVALQFLDEQEAERENNGVAKRQKVIRDVAKHTIALMGQFYEDSDERMIRILGEDNEHMMESFKMADFTKCYDVRIQNASSLPDSKAAKIQSIIDLSTAFPALFQKEQIVRMLDLASDDAFKDAATVAVKAAEYENDKMKSGEEVDEPKEWEDLLIHYDTHLKDLQSTQFKVKAPDEVRALFVNHLRVTEMIMWKKSMENALFRQKLAAYPQFPIFFRMDPMSRQQTAAGGTPPLMEPGAPQAPVQAPPAPTVAEMPTNEPMR